MARLSGSQVSEDLVLAGLRSSWASIALVTAALLAERRNLFGQVLRARAAGRAILDIALVEPLESSLPTTRQARRMNSRSEERVESCDPCC